MTDDEANAVVSMETSDPLGMNPEGVDEMKKLPREPSPVPNLSKPARNTRLELLIAAKEARELRELRASLFSSEVQNPAKKLESRLQTLELGLRPVS